MSLSGIVLSHAAEGGAEGSVAVRVADDVVVAAKNKRLSLSSNQVS